MNTKYGDRKFDPNSIKTTTLVAFCSFAIFVVAGIWILESIFIGNSYAKIRIQETDRAVSALETQYTNDPFTFDASAEQTADSSGIYIRISDARGTRSYDGAFSLKLTPATIASDLSRLDRQLEQSPFDAASDIVSPASTSNSRYLYATVLPSPNGDPHPAKMYVISPLYPVESTVSIMRTILSYISIIILAFAFIVAIMISTRIASPIVSITKSAQQLSHGNYNVKFNGESFTETQELAKALNKASYEMEQTDFYQKEILANVSHDLKTPLTMIRSYAEKIIDISGDDPERRNADLGVIISETERLNEIVNDIMTVSRLQSNRVELEKERFDIVQVAKEAYESYAVLNDQGYEIQFHPCKSTYVFGDKTRISQVMHNFISNAVKYSGDNKFVDIRLKSNSKSVSFHVIDHGVGIPKEDISHVWDRYYRTSANHERHIEGSGLGLSIVKGILSLHNANYGVDSEEGKGSDFWFEMRVIKKPSAKTGKTGKQAKNGKEK